MIRLFLTGFMLLALQLKAQKLVINTTDPSSGKIVKETQWLKIKGTDRTGLAFKPKRVGQEVKLYFKQLYLGNDNKCGPGHNYVLFVLENNETIEIAMPGMVSIWQKHKSQWRKPDAEHPAQDPFGLPTDPLTAEQLTLLQQHNVKSLTICFEGDIYNIGIKEKDQDGFRSYLALVI